jgi:outer membrane protein OmpA-like peptidoglycan-associated protein
MKTSSQHWILASAVALLVGACATVPPGPPPDVVRLQNDLDRMHSDPRIASNGGAELANADAAVDMLARNERTLDSREYQQGVYIADKLVGIAEASALARYSEQRGIQLGAERERLLAQTAVTETRTTTVVTEAPPPRTIVTEAPPPRTIVTEVAPPRAVRSETGELVPRARSELMAMQDQMPGVESRLDARGLVIRLGDFMFEPGQAELTPTAEQSLDNVARVLRSDNDAGIAIEAYGDDGMALRRANAVRDYLDARGVDSTRLSARTIGYATRNTLADRDRRVDIVIRSDYR